MFKENVLYVVMPSLCEHIQIGNSLVIWAKPLKYCFANLLFPFNKKGGGGTIKGKQKERRHPTQESGNAFMIES